MPEQQIPNMKDIAREAGARNLLGSIRERFHKPGAETLSEAKAEASQRLQGQELMQVVSGSWTAEQAAAANADQKKQEVGTHRASTRAEIINQAKVMTKLALGADIGRLSADEIAVIKGESGDWKGPAQSWMESLTQMQDELKALTEARGALPNESLKVEQASIEGIELAEAHERLNGSRILEILSEEGATEDLGKLGQAVNVGESMERARVNGTHHLSKLHERLLQRYPDKTSEIDAKYQSLAGERDKALEGFELHTESGELAPQTINDKVKEVLGSANLQRQENVESLLNSLGVKVEEDGSYTLTENSHIGALLEDGQLLEMQTKDLEKALQQAEADPRLADAALTIALTRYTTSELSRLTTGQLEQMVQEARIQESMQIADEKAAAERSAVWNKVKGFASKFGLGVGKVANNIAQGSAQALGKGVQGLGMVAAAPGLLTAKAGEFLNKRAELNRKWAAGGISGAAEAVSETTTERAQELQNQISRLQTELDALNSR